VLTGTRKLEGDRDGRPSSMHDTAAFGWPLRFDCGIPFRKREIKGRW
jgi:hypothetical protein